MTAAEVHTAARVYGFAVRAGILLTVYSSPRHRGERATIARRVREVRP